MYYSTLLSSSNFKFIAEHETAIPSSPSGGCNEFSCTTQTINLFYEGDNAVASNDIIVDTESNYIIMSAISFNIDIMDEISIYKYKYIATHEMGHTLGLRDYDETESFAKGRSILYGKYSSLYAFDDFTDEDKYFLDWHYAYGNCD